MISVESCLKVTKKKTCLWVRERPIYQGFSNFNAHPNQLGILLTCKSWYHRYGVEVLHFEPCLVMLTVPGLGLYFEQQGCRLTSSLKNKEGVEGALQWHSCLTVWLSQGAQTFSCLPACWPRFMGRRQGISWCPWWTGQQQFLSFTPSISEDKVSLCAVRLPLQLLWNGKEGISHEGEWVKMMQKWKEEVSRSQKKRTELVYPGILKGYSCLFH